MFQPKLGLEREYEELVGKERVYVKKRAQLLDLLAAKRCAKKGGGVDPSELFVKNANGLSPAFLLNLLDSRIAELRRAAAETSDKIVQRREEATRQAPAPHQWQNANSMNTVSLSDDEIHCSSLSASSSCVDSEQLSDYVDFCADSDSLSPTQRRLTDVDAVAKLRDSVSMLPFNSALTDDCESNPFSFFEVDETSSHAWTCFEHTDDFERCLDDEEKEGDDDDDEETEGDDYDHCNNDDDDDDSIDPYHEIGDDDDDDGENCDCATQVSTAGYSNQCSSSSSSCYSDDDDDDYADDSVAALQRRANRFSRRKRSALRTVRQFFLPAGVRHQQRLPMTTTTMSDDGGSSSSAALVDAGGYDGADDQVLDPTTAAIQRQMEELVVRLIDRNELIKMSAVNLKRQIGEGAYGTVYSATYGKQLVAIKFIKSERCKLETHKTFVREVRGLVAARDNPGVVGFVGASLKPLAVVTQLCRGGSLHHALHSSGVAAHLPLRRRLEIAIEVAHAMGGLHALSPPLIFRDLTTSNIVMHPNAARGTAYIIDFGIAVEAHCAGEFPREYSPVGHCRYRPPEVNRKEAYSKKVDIYFFGTVLYELVALRVPFRDVSNDVEVARLVKRGVTPQIPKSMPAPIAKLIRSCWNIKQRKRPSFKEIIARLESILRKHELGNL
jgi:Protein tyrosine and serine/threonine kinase